MIKQRREAYAADVTYGTNNEFGFDYLRDNMKFDLKDCVQRGHNFAIVDEVDSILIDEARTPLIISGASEESTDKYARSTASSPSWKRARRSTLPPGEPKQYTGDYVVDEKHRNITVTDEGWEKVEQLLGIGNIADPENWDLKHHVETAVKAHALYHRDVEYVVKDGEVIIVDEFTGRLMPGAAGPMACTSRSKPKKTSRSSARTRRWRPLPSRIISACTRSWPA